MRFSQLVALSSCFGLVVSAPQTKVSKRQSSPFLWFGVNESCAEFGQGTYPGELGVEYTWPDQATMQTLRNRGMNMFRVAFSMERLIPNRLTGPPDAAYMGDLRRTVNWITSTGAYAVLDPHNYGRYYGNIITSTADFGAFWTTVAREFASNSLVVFDTNNEYHTMDQTLVVNLNQAAINAIRAAGATSQYIFVEGNQWSGAWSWVDVNTSMGSLTDPEDRLIYEMHQYLDSDSSGTNSACVSSTIGEERVRSATQWLRSNGKRGILGEFAGANNQVCQQAVRGLLAYLAANSDVWTGALWWAAGPWWANYMYSIEPPSGPAYSPYMPILEPYFNSAGVPPASSTTTSRPTSTTTTSRPTTTTTSRPTTTTTSRPTTTPTTTTPSTPTPTATVPRWGQCGGQGWTGPTACASPYTCECQNQWYCQCL